MINTLWHLFLHCFT